MKLDRRIVRQHKAIISDLRCDKRVTRLNKNIFYEIGHPVQIRITSYHGVKKNRMEKHSIPSRIGEIATSAL